MDADADRGAAGPAPARARRGRPTAGSRGAWRERSARVRAGRTRSIRGRTPNYCSGCPHNVSTRLLPGRGRVGQPRLPLVRLDHRAAGAAHRLDDAARRRGAAVDRARAVHRPAAHGAERRRRLAVPLQLPEHPVLRRRRRQHHVQDPLQRLRRQHRRAGRRSAASPSPELTRLLEPEGVRRDRGRDQGRPTSYRGARARRRTRACRRSTSRTRCCASWRRTRASPCFIYDGLCANERRRRQKRGKQLPTSNRFVVINEEVCEGCGHCGALTNCMSLHKVETEFGPKTTDPRLVLQPGPLVPWRRLPLVRDGRDRGRARGIGGPPLPAIAADATARAGAARVGRAAVPHLHPRASAAPASSR